METTRRAMTIYPVFSTGGFKACIRIERPERPTWGPYFGYLKHGREYKTIEAYLDFAKSYKIFRENLDASEVTIRTEPVRDFSQYGHWTTNLIKETDID